MRERQSMGTLSILNTYEGDVEIKFDKDNPGEAIRAGRIITDMLRRGYALLVQLEDGSYQRAIDFDAKIGSYIIADFDPSYRLTKPDQGEEKDAEEQEAGEVEGQEESQPAKRGRKARLIKRSLPIGTTNAVAIARSAGG